jgi:peptide deformylase
MLNIKIVKYPHPALRFPAKPVQQIDRELRLLAGRMLELMYEQKGLGLAAPQVAIPIHLLVMNFEGDPARKDQECIAVNPVIIDRKGSQEGSEGCLSFPELFQNVRRAKQVIVRAYDLEGKQYEMTCVDLPSRLWQHEVDHLYGELFIDKMTPVGKLGSKEILKDLEREYRTGQRRGDIPSDAEIIKQLQAFQGLGPPGPVL